MLFSFGVVLALVLNLLQIQRNVTLFPDEVIATIFSSAWWVPPCCGTAAGECPSLFLESVGRGRGGEGHVSCCHPEYKKGGTRGLGAPDAGERQAEVGGTSDGDEVRR